MRPAAGASARPLPSGNEYRSDIDGLRAIAVLLVVAYHAFPYYFPAGFVGVDVFFVISGYLITRLIRQELDTGHFRAGDFYIRRILRLVPALLPILGLSLLLGWGSLLPDEYRQLGTYVASSGLFLTNVLALSEAGGYFATAAESKPLLHLWSLAVEEQFYLVWPWLLLLASSRGWVGPALWIAGGVALVTSLCLTATHPEAAFYAPFTRGVGLMAGAAAAWFGHTLHSPPNRSTWIAWLGGFTLLTATALIQPTHAYPGAWVLLPTAGTALLIAAGPLPMPNRVLAWPGLVHIGKISYPLYLWHWPLLSWAALIEGGVPSRTVRMAAVGAALVLAALTHVWIERPFLRQRHLPGHTRQRWAWALLLSLGASALAGWLIAAGQGMPARLPLPVAQAATQTVPDQTLETPVGLPCLPPLPAQAHCLPATGGNTARWVLLGDSHGLALSSGWARAWRDRVSRPELLVHAHGGCLPLRGIESYDQLGRSRDCYPDHETLFRWLDETDRVDVILIVARWTDRTQTQGVTGLAAYRDLATPSGSQANVFVSGLRRTLAGLQERRLQKNDTKIVWLHQVPEFPFQPPFCGQRSLWLGDWHWTAEACSLPRATIEAQQTRYRTLLAEARSGFPELIEFDPLPHFCTATRCPMRPEGPLLYRDTNHLNGDGAEWLLRRLVAQLAATPPALCAGAACDPVTAPSLATNTDR